MVVGFLLSGLRPCQDFFTKVKGLGEEQRRARGRPGERECAEECGLCGKAEGRETSLLM